MTVPGIGETSVPEPPGPPDVSSSALSISKHHAQQTQQGITRLHPAAQLCDRGTAVPTRLALQQHSAIGKVQPLGPQVAADAPIAAAINNAQRRQA